jgi:hypothetical protein
MKCQAESINTVREDEWLINTSRIGSSDRRLVDEEIELLHKHLEKGN